MDPSRTCPSCGKPIATDAPQGICPDCLIKAGFGTASGTAGGGAGAFVPPPVADIARLFPQLEVLGLLGRGGMGAVYKARQPGLDRLVALKILPARTGSEPGFAERFTREARALARLSHPNIVGVYDFGQVSSASLSPASAAGISPAPTASSPEALPALHYFLMEYVDGPNLRQVEQAGKLSPREAMQLIPQICEALQYAHDEGIVHRDIKPENVLLDKKGRVKIADFGLAKILGREPQDFRLTGAGHIMGTPNYMAPEQVEHPQAVDHRADLYSLGVVFYEMLTGELPLGKFAPPSRKVQVDLRLDHVVMRALEKEPERRYQHASDIKTDVETITTPPGPAAAAPPISEERIQKQVRWPAIGLGAAAGFGCLSFPVFVVLGVRYLRAMDPTGQFLTKPAILVILATPLVLWALMLYAALKMARLEGRAGAAAASFFAMAVPPANLVGFPVGIWSLAVLGRPEVREAFQRRRLVLAAAGAGSSARTPPWFWLVAVAPFLMVLVFQLTMTPVPRPDPLEPDSARAHYNLGNTLEQKAMNEARTIKAFQPADKPIAPEVSLTASNVWAVRCASPRTLCLFEVPNPGVERCLVLYTAQVKPEGLTGRAYLEMLCQSAEGAAYFSRGLDSPVSGSSGWVTCSTPFFLEAGQRPASIRLNLVVEGQGTVLLRDVLLSAKDLN